MDYALEAAAIAMFESHVRADKLNPTSWRFLIKSDRQMWRGLVRDTIKKDQGL